MTKKELEKKVVELKNELESTKEQLNNVDKAWDKVKLYCGTAEQGFINCIEIVADGWAAMQEIMFGLRYAKEIIYIDVESQYTGEQIAFYHRNTRDEWELSK